MLFRSQLCKGSLANFEKKIKKIQKTLLVCCGFVVVDLEIHDYDFVVVDLEIHANLCQCYAALWVHSSSYTLLLLL